MFRLSNKKSLSFLLAAIVVLRPDPVLMMLNIHIQNKKNTNVTDKTIFCAAYKCIICTVAVFSIQNHSSCQQFKVNEAARLVYCKTIRSAVLAVIHRESHTQSCFLTALHTCRGYERGINITGSTHFHLTLTSLFAFHSLSLLLSPSL